MFASIATGYCLASSILLIFRVCRLLSEVKIGYLFLFFIDTRTCIEVRYILVNKVVYIYVSMLQSYLKTMDTKFCNMKALYKKWK